MEEQYIGANLVKNVTEEDYKTSMGSKIMRVEYVNEDLNDELFTEKMFNHITSDKSVDATDLRDNRVTPIAEEILKVMAEWGIKPEEIDYLWRQKVVESLNDSVDKAHTILFKDKLGVESDKHNITLLHYDIILNEQREAKSDTSLEG